ncbi:MAG: double zinc ribbon domain-containing protein [Blastocatellia bacterium]
MKSPTGELLHLRAEANAERQPTGFTGGLDLYDELDDFLSLSPKAQPTDHHFEARPATAPHAQSSAHTPPVTVETPPPANSGALSQSEDVIRITGALEGFVAAKTASAAKITCGDCGQLSDSGELFCIRCGGLLEQVAAHAETAIALAGLCDDCGMMIEDDEIFCPSCGSVMANA